MHEEILPLSPQSIPNALNYDFLAKALQREAVKEQNCGFYAQYDVPKESATAFLWVEAGRPWKFQSQLQKIHWLVYGRALRSETKYLHIESGRPSALHGLIKGENLIWTRLESKAHAYLRAKS